MRPDPEVLKAMFGDDTPIGKFSEISLNENLMESNTISDFVKTICDYAESLHREQYDYYMISPYGGEDITVESIDSIALNAAVEAFPLLPEKGIQISMQGFEDAVCTELLQRGTSVTSVKAFIDTYTQMQQCTEKFVKDEMQRYDKDFAGYKEWLQQEIAALQQQGKQEFDVLNQQFSELKSHRIRNFFFSKQFRDQASDLLNEMDNASVKATATEDTFYKITGKDIMAHMPFPPVFDVHYCVEIDKFAQNNGFSKLLNDRDYQIDISNPEKQSALIEMANEFVNDPTNQQQFQRYSALLSRQSEAQQAETLADAEPVFNEQAIGVTMG